MKKLLIGFTLALVGTSCFAQTNFYTNVTNLWYQGYKSNVLDIANTRLAANSNDIAGLILKAEYHLEFVEAGEISNAFLRVIQTGDMIKTTNFMTHWQGFSKDRINWLLYVVAENPLSPQQIQAERQKGFINEKALPDANLIEALQKDGYFD